MNRTTIITWVTIEKKKANDQTANYFINFFLLKTENDHTSKKNNHFSLHALPPKHSDLFFKLCLDFNSSSREEKTNPSKFLDHLFLSVWPTNNNIYPESASDNAPLSARCSECCCGAQLQASNATPA